VVCYTIRQSPCRCSPTTRWPGNKPRKLRRLYDQRDKMMKALTKEYFLHTKLENGGRLRPRPRLTDDDPETLPPS